jgi:hypothetical protein
VWALGPLGNQDRIEIARRPEEPQRLLRDTLPDLRCRLTRAEGEARRLLGLANPPRPG